MPRHLNLSAIAIGFGAALSMTVLHTPPAQAVDFSFRGTFLRDDDVQLFNFTVGAPSTVTLRTYSYAGGTQADGVIISRRGFDPILALFDSTGALIAFNDDGLPSQVPDDPITGRYYDTFLQTPLAPGSYTVSVMQFDNFPVGANPDNDSIAPGANLAQGFIRSGQPTFTSIYGCVQGSFCDVATTNRTNFWAFDVLNVAQATQVEAVPEPLTVGGVLLAIGGLTAARRQRKQANSTKV